LTFVPTPYLYPTRGGPFARVMVVGGIIWTVLLLLVLVERGGDPTALAIVSLIYPLAYLALSAMVAITSRGVERSAPR